MSMSLGELISALEAENPNKSIRNAFSYPHSYRGSYDELAFEPDQCMTVGEMFKEARSVLGKTFNGYKGGKYQMDTYTTVNLAKYGDCGDQLSRGWLEYMLKDVIG